MNETTEFTRLETKVLTHDGFKARYVGSEFDDTYGPVVPVILHHFSGPNRKQRRAARKAERQRRGR